jgi:hypothetical protein
MNRTFPNAAALAQGGAARAPGFRAPCALWLPHPVAPCLVEWSARHGVFPFLPGPAAGRGRWGEGVRHAAASAAEGWQLGPIWKEQPGSPPTQCRQRGALRRWEATRAWRPAEKAMKSIQGQVEAPRNKAAGEGSRGRGAADMATLDDGRAASARCGSPACLSSPPLCISRHTAQAHAAHSLPAPPWVQKMGALPGVWP